MQILICTECFCAVSLPCAHIVMCRVLTHFSDFALEKYFRVSKKQAAPTYANDYVALEMLIFSDAEEKLALT